MPPEKDRHACVEAALPEAILHQRSQSGVGRHEPRPEDEMTASVHGSTVPKNTCPLAWWRDHKADFPDLLPLVFRYLAVPASTADAEQTFSLARHLMSFSRLHGDYVCGTMELACNHSDLGLFQQPECWEDHLL